MKILRTIGSGLKRAWLWLRDKEPAQLQAIKMTGFALAAALGVNITADVREDVSFYVTGAVAILTELQAIMTRHSVDSPKTVRDKELEAENRGALITEDRILGERGN